MAKQNENSSSEPAKTEEPKVAEVFPKLLERVERKDGSVYTKHLLADGTVVEHH